MSSSSYKLQSYLLITFFVASVGNFNSLKSCYLLCSFVILVNAAYSLLNTLCSVNRFKDFRSMHFSSLLVQTNLNDPKHKMHIFFPFALICSMTESVTFKTTHNSNILFKPTKTPIYVEYFLFFYFYLFILRIRNFLLRF